MQFKLPSLLLPLSRKCGLHISFSGMRSFYSRLPMFPDPSCAPFREGRPAMNGKLAATSSIIEDLYSNCGVQRLPHRVPCPSAPWRYKKPAEKRPFRSMWEPPCRTREQAYCKDLLPRFDAIYYKPSNKCKCFQRTWVECPPKKLRLKKLCCLDAIKPPEIQKRIKVACPEFGCQFDYSTMRHSCKRLALRCPKIQLPCCKPARCPPSCRIRTKPLNCRRLRTPFRSFSESQMCRRSKRPRECPPYFASQCDVYALYNRRRILGLKQI